MNDLFYDGKNIDNQYSRDFIRTNSAIKKYEDDELITVAVTPDCSKSIRSYLTEYNLPKKTNFVEFSRKDFASYIGNLSVEELEPIKAGKKNEELKLDSITKDAPVINIINAICINAITNNASDIHIESMADKLRIRYRIDGCLVTVKTIDLSVFQQLSTRIKIMSNLNIMEQRLPQDGRMTVRIDDEHIDIRVSTMPTTWGESIVLRIFDIHRDVLSLEKLGFVPKELGKILQCLKNPTGLILSTGPTGSGKTTTLHALLNVLNAEERNIIALEDPVEQTINGVNQVQISEEIGVTFSNMLRRVLRQDPNIIMVGEIRDSETAELALRSSLTGHLILSTLHTNDSISVISRLKNMGVEPYLISAVLRCSIAQRLVRRVCPKCSKLVKPSKEQVKVFEKYCLPVKKVKDITGCEECAYTGYKGRIVVEEVLVVDEKIEKMIEHEASDAEIRRYARTKMKMMSNNGLEKVMEGVTTFSEVEREVGL